MKAIILFHEVSCELKFGHPLLGMLKDRFPAVVLFDLDSASAPELFACAEQLAEEASEFVLIIDSSNPARALNLIELTIRNKDAAGIIFISGNAMYGRLEKILPPDHLLVSASKDEQADFIRNVLKAR